MWIIFSIFSFVLLLILILQQVQHKKIEREISYITDRLTSLSITSENGFVLIPTDNDSSKKLGAVLNTLLQDFYTKKMPYETLWCIISLYTKIYESSDLIWQTYYTTTNT